MKFFLFLLCFGLLVCTAPPRILQILRVLSEECSGHGYFWQGKCYCVTAFGGPTCSQRKGHETSDEDDCRICDDLTNRLDDLYNISPEFYLFDDDEFPRIGYNSINGHPCSRKTDTWIRMHDLTKDFRIFSNDTSVLDIGQGNLANSYFVAALASLANRKNGSILKDMFIDLNDNPNHVYVTRWLINGKPRFVAVDDWVPGFENKTRFAQLKDGKFWPLILEKAYAKIYGAYLRLNEGNYKNVWIAITQARTQIYIHKYKTTDQIFNLLEDLLSQDYAVGAIGSFRDDPHAYAILGVYNVTTDNGSQVKLVRYFNPLLTENWKTNPWGDNSANWTTQTKKQVPYSNANDGIFFSTIEDYMLNFQATDWAEINENYDLSYIDIANRYDDLNLHPFEVNFTYTGNSSTDLHVFNDQGDSRLWQNCGCKAAVDITTFSVTDPNGVTGVSGRVANPITGQYRVNVVVKKNWKFANFFTISAYAREGTVSFIPPPNNNIVDASKKQCLNNCNMHGKCNTANSKCTCYFGYTGTDCGQIQYKCPHCPSRTICDPIFNKCATLDNPCPKNCSKNGICSTSTGKCVCQTGFTGDACDTKQLLECPNNCSNHGSCDSNTGYCTCQKEFGGDGCDILYRDIICPNNCSNAGICSLEQGKCLCDKYFSGDHCDNFTNYDVKTTIKNVQFDKYLFHYYLWHWGAKLGLSQFPLNFTYTKINQLMSATGLTIRVPSWIFRPRSHLDLKRTNTYVGPQVNEKWFISKKNNYFLILSQADMSIVIAANIDGTGVELSRYNEFEPRQQWLMESWITEQYHECPMNCSNYGICDTKIGKCNCQKGYIGLACENFVVSGLVDIKNVQTNKYMSYDNLNLKMSTNSTIWNVSSNNELINDLGVCVDVFGAHFKVNARVRLYTRLVPPVEKQRWIIEKKNDYIFFKSFGNPELALTVNSDGTIITLNTFNENDKNQQWIINFN